MNGSIYIIRNSINSKVYIGQTIQSVENRFKQHIRLQKTNKNQAISKAIKALGKENFSYEVLESNIGSYSELNRLEELYIKKYNSLSPKGYNLCPGGQKWRRKPELEEAQINEIISKYNSGMSTREIAEIYKTTHNTIIAELKKHGIERRERNVNLPNKTSKLTKEIMIDLYINKNMRIKDIAELMNVNVRTINRAKNRYGLKRI